MPGGWYISNMRPKIDWTAQDTNKLGVKKNKIQTNQTITDTNVTTNMN